MNEGLPARQARPATMSPTPTPRAALPSRDLAPASERTAHVRAAQRAGVLTAEEATVMRDLIRYHPGELGELDIYRAFSRDDWTPGEWRIWSHDGERPLQWWRAVCARALHRDRGKW